MMNAKPFPLTRIISGGQTGADRAALDAALDAGFPCGGWCPKGRKAEDGRIPARYPLTESTSSRYAERTRLNIEEADCTLVVTFGEPAGGSANTIEYARGLGVPCLHVDAAEHPLRQAAQRVYAWITEHHIETLNVAGPRASKEPRAYIAVYDLVSCLISGDRVRGRG